MKTARWVDLAAGLLLLVPAVGHLHSKAAPAAYTPQTWNLTLTTVPLVVHEMQAEMPFLKKAFAASGVLGPKKEVYGFSPSTLVVYQGDTVNLTVVNPEDDDHTFTITGLGVTVRVRGLSASRASFVARTVGVFPLICTVEEHYPYMWGEIVVLPNALAGKGR